MMVETHKELLSDLISSIHFRLWIDVLEMGAKLVCCWECWFELIGDLPSETWSILKKINS
jgi:hypothetical protein